jgi:ABC-type phosphate transport system permease subunit
MMRFERIVQILMYMWTLIWVLFMILIVSVLVWSGIQIKNYGLKGCVERVWTGPNTTTTTNNVVVK